MSKNRKLEPSEDFNDPYAEIRQRINDLCPNFPKEDITLNNLQKSIFANSILRLTKNYEYKDKGFESGLDFQKSNTLNRLRNSAIFTDQEVSTKSLLQTLKNPPEQENTLIKQIAEIFTDCSQKCVEPKENQQIDKEFIESKFFHNNSLRHSNGDMGDYWQMIRKATFYDLYKKHKTEKEETIPPDTDSRLGKLIGDFDYDARYVRGVLETEYNFSPNTSYTEEHIEEQHLKIEQKLLNKIMLAIDFINDAKNISEMNTQERSLLIKEAKTKAIRSCNEDPVMHPLIDRYQFQDDGGLLSTLDTRGTKSYSIQNEAPNI